MSSVLQAKDMPKFFNPLISGSNIKELSTENDLFLKKLKQEYLEIKQKKESNSEEKIISKTKKSFKKPILEKKEDKLIIEKEIEIEKDGFEKLHKNKDNKKPFFYNFPKETQEPLRNTLKKEDIKRDKKEINLKSKIEINDINKDLTKQKEIQ